MTLNEEIEKISKKDFMENARVKKILKDFPSEEEALNNAKEILVDVDSDDLKKSKEARVYLAQENLWKEWGKSKAERILLKEEDFVMYKKLTNYMCSLSNKYSKAIKEDNNASIDKYKEIRKKIKISELEGNNLDLKDKIKCDKNG
jgi:hypothetical protein